eukprot:jgi/Chlat1/128/Chrsp1S03091
MLRVLGRVVSPAGRGTKWSGLSHAARALQSTLTAAELTRPPTGSKTQQADDQIGSSESIEPSSTSAPTSVPISAQPSVAPPDASTEPPVDTQQRVSRMQEYLSRYTEEHGAGQYLPPPETLHRLYGGHLSTATKVVAQFAKELPSELQRQSELMEEEAAEP